MSFVVLSGSDDYADRVLAALRHDRWMNADEVAALLHITGDCACRTLRRLREAGVVRSAAGRWSVSAPAHGAQRAA